MKQIKSKVVVALCTFIIGIIINSAWRVNSEPNISPVTQIEIEVDMSSSHISEIFPDSIVHTVNFCELIQNPKKYDGKIVRTQASYYQGADSSSLTDSKCKGWIQPHCNRENTQCEKINNPVRLGETKIDLIGRFKADVEYRYLYSDDNNRVNLIEILELINTKPLKIIR